MAIGIITDLSGIYNFYIHGDPTTVGAWWKKWKQSFKLFVTKHSAKESSSSLWRATNVRRLPGRGETVYTVAMEQLDQYFTPKLTSPMKDICFGLWVSYLLKASISLLQGFKKGQITVNSAMQRMKIFGSRYWEMYLQSSAKKTLEKGRELTLVGLQNTARSIKASDRQAGALRTQTTRKDWKKDSIMSKRNLKERNAADVTWLDTIRMTSDAPPGTTR